jgi:hypothetical protein
MGYPDPRKNEPLFNLINSQFPYNNSVNFIFPHLSSIMILGSPGIREIDTGFGSKRACAGSYFPIRPYFMADAKEPVIFWIYSFLCST